MTDTQQPGTEIDSEVWHRFRQEVIRRRGGVRGHLKNELENALLDYIHGGDTTPNEINERLQRIETAVGVAGTDGGADTFEPTEHTHAPPDTKPSANAATEKKVRYLAERAREDLGSGSNELSEVPREELRDLVKEEYGFRSDTAQRYVQELIDHFNLVEHPIADPLLCTPERREQMLNKQTESDLEEL